jgi:VanZ family protein
MKIVWFWFPPIGYMAVIFFVSSLSHPAIGGKTPDYILHALGYFLLALLLIRLFLVRQSQQANRADLASWHQACWLGVLIAIGYGITDEIHQYFVPGRYCSLHDVFSDVVGTMLAYGVASLDYLFLKRFRSWIAFLKHFGAIRHISYAVYRFE